MVSLISLIINLFDRRKIVEVRRMPPRRVLRAHLLGLTFGLVFVLFTLGIHILFKTNDPNSIRDFFHILSHVIIFGVGTYIGGPFVILVAILAIVTNGVLGPYFSSSFVHLADWYFIGYLFGGIFATLYNDLVFLYLISFGRRRIKIAFAYDRTSEFNIIKSPIEAEEKNLLKTLQNIPFFLLNIRQNTEVERSARRIIRLIRRARWRMSLIDQQSLSEILERLTGETEFRAQLANLRRRLNGRETPVLDAVRNDVEPLIDKYLRLNDKRLYDYELKTPTERPYTIAFVANPKILTRREPETAYDEHRADPNNYETDHIIKDRDLFMRSVDRALFTLERDEVVGQPDIWSRMRVITIFDENLATADGPRYGMVEQFQDDLIIENRVIENLVDPSEQMIENARHMFKTYDVPEQIREYVDVIYALTAARDHDRSMAH
ncbi:MAG: hypothetical protein GWN00_37995, partial [Aliifodinibius sp.]|nr:hypothetical protein [candidate division KSB1 bacterium]NIT61790.1 hypothetical protein [Fodinibius sp.]NIS28093.1 hypothetical protein [candidate division KSB1 bacterium]NIU28773.1 hypothetical protein [candidate division KSB1 bacterium]NIU92949.1 hypothetical protein [candidate division KSB1 bacterium]